MKTQHYAFLVSEAEFDVAYAQIRQHGIEHYADPHRQQRGTINHNDGGRGVYFMDPAGRAMELITVPYGGGPRRHIHRGRHPRAECRPQPWFVSEATSSRP